MTDRRSSAGSLRIYVLSADTTLAVSLPFTFTSARLQKELDAATRRTGQGEARHRSELQGVQAQLADARHQAGVLEGRLVAVRDTSAGYARELGLLRQQLTGAVAPRSAGRKGAPVTVPARKPPRADRKAASAKKPG